MAVSPQVLGRYPSDLSEAGEFILPRGRALPSTSWEAVWHAVAQWFGVEEGDLPTVLPNMVAFGAQGLFNSTQMFEVF